MLSSWGAAQSSGPTAVVPVAAKICRLVRYRHDVADPWADVVIAARADVGLDGLVGLHPSNLAGDGGGEVERGHVDAQPRMAQRRTAAHTMSPDATNT